MARFRPKQQGRYESLVRAHFTSAEAFQFSKLRLRYPALRQMRRQRSAMWANFKQESYRKGWGATREKQEFLQRINRLYTRLHKVSERDKETGLSISRITNWIVRRDVHGNPIKAKISPWDYYDSVFKRLPDELKWDTPRTHRSRRNGQGEVKLDRVRAQRWVADLRKSMARTNDPDARERYRTQIANLTGRGLRRRSLR